MVCVRNLQCNRYSKHITHKFETSHSKKNEQRTVSNKQNHGCVGLCSLEIFTKEKKKENKKDKNGIQLQAVNNNSSEIVRIRSHTQDFSCYNSQIAQKI